MSLDPLAPSEEEVADFDPYEGREYDYGEFVLQPDGTWHVVDGTGEEQLYEDFPRGEWKQVVGSKTLTGARAAEFGFGEETVGMLEFSDPVWYEVGIGESLQPYQVCYLGADRDEALAIFNKIVEERKAI